MKITNHDRYGTSSPTRTLEVPEAERPALTDELGARPDTDRLEELFAAGWVHHYGRVTLENGRTWRCDGSGWSLVIDPEVADTYTRAADGTAVLVPFHGGRQ